MGKRNRGMNGLDGWMNGWMDGWMTCDLDGQLEWFD